MFSNRFYSTTLLAVTVLSASPAYAAHSIEGLVKDAKGAPVKNAKVFVHGSTLVVTTDQSGRFKLTEQMKHIEELHVVASGFNHASVKLSENITNYNIVLSFFQSEITIFCLTLHFRYINRNGNVYVFPLFKR